MNTVYGNYPEDTYSVDLFLIDQYEAKDGSWWVIDGIECKHKSSDRIDILWGFSEMGGERRSVLIDKSVTYSRETSRSVMECIFEIEGMPS